MMPGPTPRHHPGKIISLNDVLPGLRFASPWAILLTSLQEERKKNDKL